MSKYPTKSRLIGLTDILGVTELFHEMATLLEIPVVHQNYTSVLTLATKGDITMTKHWRAWINGGKESLQEQINTKYTNTEEMVADGLCKPIEGEAYQQLRVAVMGEVSLA